MNEPSQTDIDLQKLEAALKQLEAEYNMYFSGQAPRPPWATRSRVAAQMARCDRTPRQNYGDRYRFETLQSRFATFTDLWDRALRAREEGRPGPLTHLRQDKDKDKNVKRQKAGPVEDVRYVTLFHDPQHEMEKLRELFDALADIRRETGEPIVPFHKLADLVRKQVATLQGNAECDVAFRVAVKDGKTSFTARALKGPRPKPSV